MWIIHNTVMNLLLKHSYFAESPYVQFSRTKQKPKNELIYRLEKRMVQSRFSTDPRVHIHIQQSKQQVMGHIQSARNLPSIHTQRHPRSLLWLHCPLYSQQLLRLDKAHTPADTHYLHQLDERLLLHIQLRQLPTPLQNQLRG